MRTKNVIVCAVGATGLALCALLLLQDREPIRFESAPSARGSANDADPADPLQVAGASVGARLEAARSLVDEDAAELGSIAVPRQLEGRVVDAGGQPVSGAAVSLRLRRPGPPDPASGRRAERFGAGERQARAARSVPTVSTGADGRFSLSAEASAQTLFEIGVEHGSFAPAHVRRAGVVDADVVRLEDIVLVRGVTVSGVVVGEDDHAIPGATVRYRGAGPGDGGPGRRERGGSELERLLEQAIGAVVTDANGGFQLQRVPLEPFVLTAEAERHLPGISARFAPDGTDELADVRIRLPSGAELSGVVLDRAGVPIAGAAVEADRVAGEAGRDGGPRRGRGREPGAGEGGRSAETDAQGRFRFAAVARDGVRLTVQHSRFIEERLELVDPTVTPSIEVRMDRRLAVTGIVVDAATQQPVEVYAIEARRVDRNRPDNGGRGRNRRAGEASSAEEPAAVEAGDPGGGRRGRRDDPAGTPDQPSEREQRLAQRTAQLAERLGPSGEIPGRTPEPTPHAGGRFAIVDLEPDSYVFDIAAPGYVKIAAGVLVLERGQDPPAQVFRLARGLQIAGRVVDARRQPVADARVELSLHIDEGAGDPDGRRVPDERGRRGPGSLRLDSVPTGADGSFAFGPQRPGGYRLRVSAPDRPDLTHDIVLPARGIDDLVLTVRTGARVYGQVRDLLVGERASVVFMHTEGDRREAEVDPATGRYEVRGLPGGGYVVRVEPLRAELEDGFRRQLGMRLAAESGRPPDLQLAEGAEVQYDPELGEAFLGTVAGTVSVNQRAARGLAVRLQLAEGAVPVSAPGWNGAGRRFAERLLTARVDADGTFELGMVLPGSYTLEVVAGDRGGRGGQGDRSALHREPVVVPAGGVVERHLFLVAGRLRLSVQHAETGAPVERAAIALVPLAEAADRDPRDWAQLPSYQEIRLRNGGVDIADFRIGTYRFAIRGRGIAEQIGQLDVVAGTDADPVVVRVATAVTGTATGGAEAERPPEAGVQSTQGAPGASSGRSGGRLR